MFDQIVNADQVAGVKVCSLCSSTGRPPYVFAKIFVDIQDKQEKVKEIYDGYK